MAKAKQQGNPPTEAESLKAALGLSFGQVEIDGEVITMRRFNLDGVFVVTEALEKLQSQFVGMGEGDARGELVSTIIRKMPDMAGIIIAAGARRTESWARDLDYEQVADALAITIQVNESFFSGRALQRIAEALLGTIVSVAPVIPATATSDSLPS